MILHCLLKNSNTNQISPNEWYKLNSFVQDLKSVKNRCISIYYPHRNEAEIISLLQKTRRDAVAEKIESLIEKKIIKLQKDLENTTQIVNTLCVFGWLHKGVVKIKYIAVSKKLPYIYMLGKKPYVKPFKDILKVDYKVMVVIVDSKSARLTLLQGSKVINETRTSIHLIGRHRKGGQSQGRFLRARQTKIHVFFKKVAKKVLEMYSNDVDIIFLGGNGQAKIQFHDELDPKLMGKCRFVDTISLSTTPVEIHKKLIPSLYMYRKKYVTIMLERFEQKVKDGKTARKNSVIKRALARGAVEILFVSAQYHSNPRYTDILKMLEMAENTSARIEFVVAPNLVKRLQIYDSVLATLRYHFK